MNIDRLYFTCEGRDGFLCGVNCAYWNSEWRNWTGVWSLDFARSTSKFCQYFTWFGDKSLFKTNRKMLLRWEDGIHKQTHKSIHFPKRFSFLFFYMQKPPWSGLLCYFTTVDHISIRMNIKRNDKGDGNSISTNQCAHNFKGSAR